MRFGFLETSIKPSSMNILVQLQCTMGLFLFKRSKKYKNIYSFFSMLVNTKYLQIIINTQCGMPGK